MTIFASSIEWFTVLSLASFSFLKCSDCSVETVAYWKWSTFSTGIPFNELYWITLFVIWRLWWEINLWRSMVVSYWRYLISFQKAVHPILSALFVHWKFEVLSLLCLCTFHYYILTVNLKEPFPTWPANSEGQQLQFIYSMDIMFCCSFMFSFLEYFAQWKFGFSLEKRNILAYNNTLGGLFI